jgi:hypothetical protein
VTPGPDLSARREVLALNIDVIDGSFAIDAEPVRFEHCRERFAADFRAETRGLFFKHPPAAGPGVAAFLAKTEAVLDLADRSTYACTNWPTITWVGPTRFWMACELRRSLLTILLRAGMLFEPDRDNYEEALFRADYVRPTKAAVMRFLFGFTEYVGPPIVQPSPIHVRGWRAVFDGQSVEAVKRMLVRPGGRGGGPGLEAALWA